MVKQSIIASGFWGNVTFLWYFCIPPLPKLLPGDAWSNNARAPGGNNHLLLDGLSNVHQRGFSSHHHRGGKFNLKFSSTLISCCCCCCWTHFSTENLSSHISQLTNKKSDSDPQIYRSSHLFCKLDHFYPKQMTQKCLSYLILTSSNPASLHKLLSHCTAGPNLLN